MSPAAALTHNESDHQGDLCLAERAPIHPNARISQVALVLQGGGALGAYQAGVFRAIHEKGYLPDWFAGTSIGAINAAIMAGSAPDERVQHLEAFWKKISRLALHQPLEQFLARRFVKMWSAWQTALLGQPGFFHRRALGPLFASPGTAASMSYYAADELRQTLEDIVDLERMNSGGIRLSLGAVNIVTGEQVYFDSRTQRLGYEHILASAALPPAFPPVEINGQWYWDGGIVSNTPLDVIIDQLPRRSTLCFMVDLFDAAGPMPQTIENVEARRKDIIYASRSGRSVEAHRAKHDLRRAVMALWEALPPEKQKVPHLKALAELGCTTTMHIVRIVHHTDVDDLPSKDFEFSEASISALIASGYRDACRMLERQPWLEPVGPDIGVVIHELRGEENDAI